MFDLTLIGIGTGNPDHVTGQGAKAIRAADLILIPRKGDDKGDLAGIRETIIAATGSPARIAHFDIPKRRADKGYLRGVDDWHDAIARIWHQTIAAADPAPQSVALLIWGDPSLYDSSLRIAARLDPRPETHVIPGITALQALTAAHAIPLNEIGAPVLITTGRQLRDHGWPQGVDTIAIMLDGQCSFQSLDPAGLRIWWGAYLGMENQLAITGDLAQVSAQIIRARAAARTTHGWIMDIYLLKKTPPDQPER